jgi:hypothetical protein
MAWFPTDPHSVTPGWLSEVLGADVRECRLEQIGIGVGILGRVFRVHLRGVDVPTSVVVKLPTLDPKGAALCADMDFYLCEARFYEEIGVANPLRPARPYFVAFDPATHEFILVLEDLQHLRVNDQLAGCSVADAEVVVDAIAEHHAHWWESDRFASMTWLKAFNDPPYPQVITGNFVASWPVVLDRFGDQLSRQVRDLGDRLPSLANWYTAQLARPPVTFAHGDLRLDQLFFAATGDDPPLTALDWQVSTRARGAYDLAYFLSQSMTTETRRSCEKALIERYAERLAQRGIHYGAEQLEFDYRLAIGCCFIYPVLGIGRVAAANKRQEDLMRMMLMGAIAAIEDHDVFALGPD